MKTVKIWVAALIGVLGVALGFLCAAVLNFPPTDASLESGNISKVGKYSKNVVSSAVSPFQEKVMNSPEEYTKAAASLAFLTARMSQFEDLVDIADAACNGIPELESSVASLKSARKLAANAKAAGEDALASFDALTTNGPADVASSYEQTSQNLSLAYLLVDRQVSLGKDFVGSVNSYLRGKQVSDFETVAAARDLWADYCAGSAVMAGDKDEEEYWQKQGHVLSPDNLAFVFDTKLNCGEAFQKEVFVSNKAMADVVCNGVNSEASRAMFNMYPSFDGVISNNVDLYSPVLQQTVQAVFFSDLGATVVKAQADASIRNQADGAIRNGQGADAIRNQADGAIKNGSGAAAALIMNQEAANVVRSQFKEMVADRDGMGGILNYTSVTPLK